MYVQIAFSGTKLIKGLKACMVSLLGGIEGYDQRPKTFGRTSLKKI
jgi:hypothetical protein